MRRGSGRGSRRSASTSYWRRRCPTRSRPSPAFVNRERAGVDLLIVTGGLGGTPDDLTREAIAAAFGVRQVEVPELADELRKRYRGAPTTPRAGRSFPPGAVRCGTRRAARRGSRSRTCGCCRGCRPRWRRCSTPTPASSRASSRSRRGAGGRDARERHRPLLASATTRWPTVSIGSYPRFEPTGPEVEVVLKSADAKALAEAVAWLEPALEDRSRARR